MMVVAKASDTAPVAIVVIIQAVASTWSKPNSTIMNVIEMLDAAHELDIDLTSVWAGHMATTTGPVNKRANVARGEVDFHRLHLLARADVEKGDRGIELWEGLVQRGRRQLPQRRCLQCASTHPCLALRPLCPHPCRLLHACACHHCCRRCASLSRLAEAVI